MEIEMKRSAIASCGGILLAFTVGTGQARAEDKDDTVAGPAVGTELFVSTDSDDTNITRFAVDFDLRNLGPDNRVGIRFEKAWFSPQGRESLDRERVFLLYGAKFDNWHVKARIGTDMNTLIGGVSANDNAPLRKEIFIDRDIVETPLGLDDTPIYTTFAGAAIDLPINDRNVMNLLAGFQTFTGNNERVHLRGTYSYAVKPEWGLSLQLRGRYFHSSSPREFDYYSPEYYAQVLPVLQMRRFFRDGWMLLTAGGIGVQRDSNTDWRQSNFGQLKVESPRGIRDWSLSGEIIYTEAPSNSAATGPGYSYFQTLISATKRF